MSKISYPQLIKNIADVYRDATSSSELVAVGELTSKLAEAMNNAGSSIGVEYKSIIYNEDDTITLIDTDDVEHIMTCKYEDLKLTSVTLDDEIVPVTYVGDSLASVDGTSVDIKIKEEKISFDNFYSNSIHTKEDLTGTKFYRENVSTGENFTKSNYGFIDLFVPANTQYKISFTLADYQCVSDDSITIGVDPSKPKEGYAPSNRLIDIGLNNQSDYVCPIDYSYTFPLKDIDTTYYFCIDLWSKYYYRDTYVVLDNFNFTTIEDTGTGDTINKRIIKNKEYQNGFIVGLASKGKAIQKSRSCESYITSVTLPVNGITVIAAKNNSNTGIETSVVIESEE